MDVHTGDIFLGSVDFRNGASISVNDIYVANGSTMIDYSYFLGAEENKWIILNTHCGYLFFLKLLKEKGFTKVEKKKR